VSWEVALLGNLKERSQRQLADKVGKSVVGRANWRLRWLDESKVRVRASRRGQFRSFVCISTRAERQFEVDRRRNNSGEAHWSGVTYVEWMGERIDRLRG